MNQTSNIGVRRFLTLILGETGIFGIDIHVVREILDYTDIARLPRMPDHMRGVVDVRGQAVPVLDLGLKLGFGPVNQTLNTRIVIVEQPDPDGGVRLVGALTEAVKEVLELDAQAIAPPPGMGTDVEAACIQGIARHNGRFIILLDTARVFSDEDLAGLASLTQQAATHHAA
ncbi:chemotaxis protein CheW [Solidesulfovibrio magneticus]|uniref:Chemotaxis protein CheW n=1 Tax=Solidesulfovibrio magneticus (strain ATCC 700980 / DSM 13731 / RS-1) TaxID=573370 RepID=C4XSS9_SOLM1|nr:chemotaxis protein CheW [Solidesulfovibrio magneticus]BAH75771.1 chemotaxis protein CheW [Solidesulfovibrio magneticus RS-1]